jgi:hypothetical protein
MAEDRVPSRLGRRGLAPDRRRTSHRVAPTPSRSRRVGWEPELGPETVDVPVLRPRMPGEVMPDRDRGGRAALEVWMGGLVPGWPLALFRMAFGLLYLDMALQKAPWKQFGWLRGWIEQEIAHPAFPAVAELLRESVLPNLALFGLLTFVVEMALGVALVLGLFTRLAGLAGALWQVNIAIQAYAVPGEWYWIWPLLTLPQLCFAFSGAGRVLGADRYLTRPLARRAAGGARWARWLHRAV